MEKTHDHRLAHPLLTQPRHDPNHAPTRDPPATSDPTEGWYSSPMPRTGVDHAGALYGRVYGDHHQAQCPVGVHHHHDGDHAIGDHAREIGPQHPHPRLESCIWYP